MASSAPNFIQTIAVSAAQVKQLSETQGPSSLIPSGGTQNVFIPGSDTGVVADPTDVIVSQGGMPISVMTAAQFAAMYTNTDGSAIVVNADGTITGI